jgi:hypothetical protein
MKTLYCLYEVFIGKNQINLRTYIGQWKKVFEATVEPIGREMQTSGLAVVIILANLQHLNTGWPG